MFNEVFYNFWDVYTKYNGVCCTINTVVKSNGDLVMGAGIAKAFASKFPNLPRIWGTKISQWPQSFTNIIVTPYCGLPSHLLTQPKNAFIYDCCFIAFPTKHHYKNSSDIKLIERSAKQLALVTDAMCWTKVLLPRPGCGCGSLQWSDVKEVLADILDKRFDIIC